MRKRTGSGVSRRNLQYCGSACSQVPAAAGVVSCSCRVTDRPLEAAVGHGGSEGGEGGFNCFCVGCLEKRSWDARRREPGMP
jgi:hypothetical protein